MNGHLDGGARGTPGPARFRARVAHPDGTIVTQISGSVGTAANIVAEYRGPRSALEWGWPTGSLPW
jgi:ribonuclease HI